MTETRWDDVVRVYQSTPGGQDMLEWFQGRCDAHDAEILGFELRRSGTGALRLFW